MYDVHSNRIGKKKQNILKIKSDLFKNILSLVIDLETD